MVAVNTASEAEGWLLAFLKGLMIMHFVIWSVSCGGRVASVSVGQIIRWVGPKGTMGLKNVLRLGTVG